MSTALATHTYLPPVDDALGSVSDLLHQERAAALVAPDGSRIDLPDAVFEVLVQVVDSMNAGKAVHVTPVDQLLTTQQAADLLGVTRPTVIAILERGELAYERAGSHRRIRMDDLLAFRARRRDEQLATIAALHDDADDEASAQEILQRAKRARKAVASARKARQREQRPPA